MNGELRRLLAPKVAAVESAQTALDTSNRDPNGHPLDALASAGKVIREQQALIDTLTGLLDRRDPDGAECECEAQLRLHGQLRRLAEQSERAHAKGLTNDNPVVPR